MEGFPGRSETSIIDVMSVDEERVEERDEEEEIGRRVFSR